MDIQISVEADLLLSHIYDAYLKKRKDNVPKATAKFFGSSENLVPLVPFMIFEDIDDTCRELGRAGLLSIRYADNICYHISLSDAGIVYMENRFGNQVSKLLDHIHKLVSIIKPFA